MTEQTNPLNPENAVPSDELPDAQLAQKTAGQLLREAREAQGMDIGLLASMLKVSASQLEKLEADQYDQLPDMAFTRNFAISVCRRLKLDEKLVLQRLPKLNSQTVVNAAAKLSQSSYGTTLKHEVLGRKKSFHIWWMALLILLVVLALLFFMPKQWYEGVLFGSGTKKTEEGVSVPVQIVPPVLQTEPQNTLPLMDTVITEDGADNGMHFEPVDAASLNQIGAIGQEEEVVAAQEIGKLEITTKTESWVRVKSASGKTLDEKMLRAGAVLSFSLENLPLTVRIGNAKDASVTVRGQSFDMSSSMDTGVANFEVK